MNCYLNKRLDYLVIILVGPKLTPTFDLTSLLIFIFQQIIQVVSGYDTRIFYSLPFMGIGRIHLVMILWKLYFSDFYFSNRNEPMG